jgi:hypothetical protein
VEIKETLNVEVAPELAIEIRLDQLTWGELEELESLAGPEATDALMAGNVRPSAMVPLMWITLRRADPTVTIEAVRALPMSTEIRVRGETANPTANGEVKRSPRSPTSTTSARASSSA